MVLSKGHKTWFPLNKTAFLPVVALMLSSHGGYQHVSSGTGLGAGCVPAASALKERAAGGKDFSNACEVLLSASQIIPKVRAAPDFCGNTT